MFPHRCMTGSLRLCGVWHCSAQCQIALTPRFGPPSPVRHRGTQSGACDAVRPQRKWRYCGQKAHRFHGLHGLDGSTNPTHLHPAVTNARCSALRRLPGRPFRPATAPAQLRKPRVRHERHSQCPQQRRASVWSLAPSLRCGGLHSFRSALPPFASLHQPKTEAILYLPVPTKRASRHDTTGPQRTVRFQCSRTCLEIPESP